MASHSLCNSSRFNHLPGAWNELPVISRYGTLHRETLSVSSEGSYWIWFQHLPFAFVIANTWAFLSSFSHCDTKPCLILSFFFPLSFLVLVLPSPLPASPFLPSAHGTRWTTGSRAWPSVYTGTWGRSRTTSAQRTRSSEAVSQDPRGLLQGLQDSWGPGFSLTVLCAILSFKDRGGLTKLHSTNHHFNVALHKDLNAMTKKSFGAKQHFCCSLPCFILVAHQCGN